MLISKLLSIENFVAKTKTTTTSSNFKWSFQISFINIIAVFIISTLSTSNCVKTDESKLTKYYKDNSLWDEFDGKLEFDNYLGESLVAQDLVFGLDTDIHRYDSASDLKQSFSWPSDSDEKQIDLFIQNESRECGLKLDRILQQTRDLYANSTSFMKSKNLALIDLLDSFGSPNSQILLGSYWWLGSYDQCKQAKFESKPARYCVSKLRSPNWHERSQHLKISLCLPENCNSLTVRAHINKLQELVRISRLQVSPFNAYTLSDVYCLPDTDSPLRKFHFSAGLFVYLSSVWILLLIGCNLYYEYLRMAGANKRPVAMYLLSSFSLRENLSGIFPSNPKPKPIINPNATTQTNVVQKYNTQDNGEDAISNVINHDNNNNNEIINGADNGINNQVAVKSTSNVASSSGSKAPNLNYIDGIKVMSMLWLIGGHWLLYMMRTINNQRNFWTILKDPHYMAILSGIFPVDSFFVVTGFLVSYQRFYKRDHETKFSSLKYWIEFIYKRYTRLMPMYAIVFWFTRDVSQYLTDGPLWDYATSNTTVRGICKQEPITEALLFRASFKPLEAHCVKPAWYLACDFHFLCVAPFYLYALAKAPRLAKTLIYSSILLSFSNQFLSVYTRTDVDFETLINYRPLFPVYVLIKFWQIYVIPWNRITPFLIGLLTGHKVFMEQQQQQQKLQQRPDGAATANNVKTNQTLKQLIGSYLGLDLWAPIFVLLFIAHFALLSLLYTYTDLAARIGTSIVMAVMRLVWSIAAARLIYICNNHSVENEKSQVSPSSKGNLIFRLFNSPTWTPFSRIGLSVLLIQWEVIALLAQSPDHLPNMKLSFLYTNIYIAMTATYSLSLVGYLIFEAPIANLEHNYVSKWLFSKQSSIRLSKTSSPISNKS